MSDLIQIKTGTLSSAISADDTLLSDSNGSEFGVTDDRSSGVGDVRGWFGDPDGLSFTGQHTAETRGIWATPGDLDTGLSGKVPTTRTVNGHALSSNVTVTATDVGLGNVDNTSNATERAATATLANKTLTTPVINSPTGLVKADVGLSNVDNTSNVTERAASATLTNKDLTSGTNTFPTLNQDTTGKSAKTDALNSATTIVNVAAATAPSSGQVLTATDSTHATWQTPAGAAVWGSITGTLSSQSDLNTALGGKVPTTTTVNGHALSSNVTVTATDVGLGNVDNTSNATERAATATLTNKNLSSGTNTFPTFNQSTTGSAATLTTPRAIYGNNFDGSAALTQVIGSAFGGTANGFTKFTGPATSEKTFTLPNASATILTDNALVTVAQGGSGAGTLTGILKGNGTSAFTAVTAPSGALVGTTDTQTLTNKDLTTSNTFPTFNQDTTGKSAKTDGLNSATTAVSVSAATAPSANQVLKATDSTHATWQTLAESDVTNLVTDLGLKAALASPALTGTPTAPTASPLTASTQIATTAYVDASTFEAQPAWHSVKAWSADPSLMQGGTIIPTGGVLNVVRIWTPVAINITTIYTHCTATSAGLTNAGFALFAANGSLLQSVVASAGANLTQFQTAGLKSVTISSQAIAAGASFFIGFWFTTGTSLPTLLRGSNVTQGGAVINLGLSSSNFRWSTADTGLTTTAPSPMGAQTSIATSWWVAVA